MLTVQFFRDRLDSAAYLVAMVKTDGGVDMDGETTGIAGFACCSESLNDVRWEDGLPARQGGQALSVLHAAVLQALFDELTFGVALVDEVGRVQHASRTARAQLGGGFGLHVSGDTIEAESGADQAALQGALDAACSGRRSYLVLGSGDRRIEVAVLPVAAGERRGARAALVLERAAGGTGLGLYFFARAHGLTRAEQAVLSALSEGASVVDAARQLGSSIHTVRTHVRNILAKTGLPNLRSLARRLGMLPPVGGRIVCASGQAGARAEPDLPRGSLRAAVGGGARRGTAFAGLAASAM